MPLVAAVIGLAAVVWWAICARRGSLIIGCGMVVAVAYVLGHEFWHAKVGALPLTIDRLFFVALLAAFAVQWRIGRLHIRSLNGNDWILLALVLFVCGSAAVSGQPEFSDDVTSKWGRLVASFILPALLYCVARHAQISPRAWRCLLSGLVVLGAYLAITAVLEITGRWSLVFPRYIADPDLGIHFGRARGPELNAASLGLYLTACLWCAWTLLSEASRRWQQLVLAAMLPLMALGVLFTYTRSTWMGLAASGLVVAILQIPRRWRLPALAAATLGGLLIAAASWGHIVGLQREGTAAESHHSVSQRASFAYVSWQMFRDHPVFGVGFGRFYDRKLPYLSDRSQNFELESVRPLHHHNTLLSVLTETGLVGLALFAAVLAAWTACALQLARFANSPRWVRAHGILMLALSVNYLCSAMFHDLTLLPSQHALLFMFAGLTVNVRQQFLGATAGRTSWVPARIENALLGKPAMAVEPALQVVTLFGMRISRITMSQTVNQLLEWCSQPRGQACRFIVTPNVDHAVLFQHRSDLRAAYADASLVLADGTPLVLASRLLRRELPERVAGSDLVPRLLEAANRPLRLFLLGAAPGVAQTAAARIQRRWPAVQVVGAYSPLLGFEHDDEENARILAAVAAAEPDLLVIGLGAPKQELWVHRHRHQLKTKVAICAGATIDFLAGNRRRSPVWMRRCGLEWVHRVCCEPRRLAGRYARDAWVFPQLVWREWRQIYS